ncbi:MAG: 3-phosphoshikimate 1-carboxyvinyltransferase [Woeseiaceae bacterium]|nr:3-phosphoshikimate 1-carboxyvinyltransferase [Woeseiaceae bacterium]
MDFIAKPAGVGHVRLRVPGDKSVSHRSIMLGSLATGTTRVSGFLPGDDCLATLRAFRDMGVQIEEHDATTLTIHGVGLDGLQAPPGPLDLGNSGTGMRLMAGVLAGQAFDTELVGDESLSGRPMARIINPLTEMGAAIESDCDGTPPLQISGGVRLRSIDYVLPMASAQVKSCVLLAGMYADGTTSVTEPDVTRDHTERMLRTMGAEIASEGRQIAITGRPTLTGCNIEVPGDLSSAAFVMLAAALADDADVLIENVGINPTRTGVIDILRGMGANIELERVRKLGEEPVADIRVQSSRLVGGTVDPALVSLAIDEFPVLFVAAAAADGETVFSGIGELRVKESDRIAAMATGLRSLGIRVDESDDGAVVHGGRFAGGEVDSFHDHRIAMSLSIAGTVADGPVRVRGVDNVATSFPGFVELLESAGASIGVEAAA